MIDCEKCKYYHDNCDAKFRCRIDVERIRADAIDECIEKLYEVTPQTVDEKLDMVFVNALRELKGQKNESKRNS